MPDHPHFSQKLLDHDGAQSEAARERIALAKRRIQNTLDRERVAHQKTLEQKIAEQGPMGQRVDPHLIGLAIMDLTELNRLAIHHHASTTTTKWFANPATPAAEVQERLNTLAPLYKSVSGDGFGNQTGDALEVIVFKCLDRYHKANPRYSYLGQLLIDQPKNQQGRYEKLHPPKHIAGHSTTKEFDFIQVGYDAGPLGIECKNYREWFYPHHTLISELIIKSHQLNVVPVLIARRLHYTTKSNFLQPAGIIAHESYYQYYPADKADLAAQAKHKRSLGFTDVVATEEPHPRTTTFSKHLPSLVEPMANTGTTTRTRCCRMRSAK